MEGKNLDRDYDILMELKEIEERFGVKSSKFSGALLAETVKSHLENEGFKVSNRDVFIQGIKNELDLLILKPNARSISNLCYDVNEVLAVLELKKRGAIGYQTRINVKNLFDTIVEMNSNIRCVYLTLTERKTYTFRVSEEELGHAVFELFPREKGIFNFEKFAHGFGVWNKFVSFLTQ